MSVARLGAVFMPDNHEPPVIAPPAAVGDSPLLQGINFRALGGGKVDAAVLLGSGCERVLAQAEPRGEPSRASQQSVERFFDSLGRLGRGVLFQNASKGFLSLHRGLLCSPKGLGPRIRDEGRASQA